MRLDIRLPIGLMFGILGGLLVIFGLLSSESALQHSLGINVNLWWGIVMFVFGAVMFIFGRRGNATTRLAEESLEGRKVEEMEHEQGLEK
ncbi:MAG TPA: hypothetical protein VN696_08160 [Pyrinomonadaceae bacterium]|nr:hypothetical protein [Pyrinomonadaceae bacterium]